MTRHSTGIALAGPEILDRADELADVYRQAFGAAGYDEPEESVNRFLVEQLPVHASREGFRCAVAIRDGDLVGFAYGYTGQVGQWWSNHVLRRAPADVVRGWVGGHFEFVELAVKPSHQNRGIGSDLHDTLMKGLPHKRAMLTTYADDRPAVRLYRRKGWRLLLAGLDTGTDLYGIELASAIQR
jgi:ribosomal protein S18 acetylase RimI-like enzyme